MLILVVGLFVFGGCTSTDTSQNQQKTPSPEPEQTQEEAELDDLPKPPAFPE